jgi:putative inorganic carbon (HCO3(-)) transporter
MRFFYLGVLVLTPFLHSLYFNRVFEGSKVILLFIACGALCIWAGMRLLRLGNSFPPRNAWTHPITLWLLLFFLSYSISTAFSMAPRLSVIGAYERQLGWVSLTMFLAWYFLTLGLFRDGKVRPLFVAVSVPATLVALVAAGQALGWFPLGFAAVYDEFFHRVFSTLGHPVYLGLYLCLTIPLAAALALDPQAPPILRKGLWAMLPVMVFAMTKTLSRGAMIGMAVSTVIFLFCHFKYVRGLGGTRKQNGLLFFGVIFVFSGFIGLLFLVDPGLAARLRTVLFFTHTDRFQLLKGTLALIGETPFLGFGPETFRIVFLPHKSLELARLFPAGNHDRAHNQYLHLWVVQGVPGLFAYLGLLTSALRTALSVLKNKMASVSTRIWALGLGSAFAGYAVAILPAFDNVVSLLLFHLLLGALVILDCNVAVPAEAAPKETAPSPAVKWQSGQCALMAGLGLGFIWFGGAVALADHAYVLGRDNKVAENKLAYLRAAARRMPWETFYQYELARALWEHSTEEKTLTEDQKRADLLQAANLLSESFLYTWLPENYVQLLSLIYVDLKNYERAESVLLKFLRMDPYNSHLRTNLVLALGHQNKFRETLELLQQWKKRVPEDVNNYWYAGLAYESMGNYAEAEKEILLALERAPGKPEYVQELERVRKKLNGAAGAKGPAAPVVKSQEG